MLAFPEQQGLHQSHIDCTLRILLLILTVNVARPAPRIPPASLPLPPLCPAVPPAPVRPPCSTCWPAGRLWGTWTARLRLQATSRPRRCAAGGHGRCLAALSPLPPRQACLYAPHLSPAPEFCPYATACIVSCSSCGGLQVGERRGRRRAAGLRERAVPCRKRRALLRPLSLPSQATWSSLTRCWALSLSRWVAAGRPPAARAASLPAWGQVPRGLHLPPASRSHVECSHTRVLIM